MSPPRLFGRRVAPTNSADVLPSRYCAVLLSSYTRLENDDTATKTDRNGLGPILRSQFVHNPFDMHFDGVLRDPQMLPNVAIAVAFGNAPQNLDLALRERVSADVHSQTFGYNCRQMFAPRVHLADDSDQFIERSALQDVAECSGCERALNLVIALKCRHDDHPSIRKLLPNGSDGANSAHIGKPEIHERDIRSVLPKFLKSRFGRACSPDQYQILLISNDGCDSLAEGRVIVDAEDSDSVRGTHGGLPR